MRQAYIHGSFPARTRITVLPVATMAIGGVVAETEAILAAARIREVETRVEGAIFSVELGVTCDVACRGAVDLR
jgi:hypothetical protein